MVLLVEQSLDGGCNGHIVLLVAQSLEPGVWQRLVVIGVRRGCSWHGVANLLFVLHFLPDAGVNSFCPVSCA